MTPEQSCQKVIDILNSSLGNEVKVDRVYPNSKVTKFCNEPSLLIDIASATETSCELSLLLYVPLEKGSKSCDTIIQKVRESLANAENFYEYDDLKQSGVEYNESIRAYQLKATVYLQKTMQLSYGESTISLWSGTLKLTQKRQIVSTCSPLMGDYLQDLGRKNRILTIQGAGRMADYTTINNLYLNGGVHHLVIGNFIAEMIFSSMIVTQMSDNRVSYLLGFTEVSNS